MKNYDKYKAYPIMNMPSRIWPNKTIKKPPLWCSVDLRDGNQALETPMTLEQKIKYFNFLVHIGFKEIEVGFPAASETEYQFTRELIERKLIPDDVSIQVLTQAREHIIDKTFLALKGAKKAIIHLYNSTSEIQRKVVFHKDKEQIIELAEFGARLILDKIKQHSDGEYTLEYSPESFTGTEMDYAVEISNAVMDIWKPNTIKKAILNLPSTVEMTMPNVYADQIEYVCKNIKNRESLIISIHTHNDRGCAVAASELGVLAGAERIEGTLFGNGERTGNADIITLAMNLFSQGIDPQLDFSHMAEVINMYETNTGMSVSKRHPYAGGLVYTAFSGSHQDAIKKGMEIYKKEKPQYWQIPYLPIDPMDVGCSYDPIIRINSQSGKGGVAYILEKEYGLRIPKLMQQEFGEVITNISDKSHKELSSEDIYNAFKQEYVNIQEPIELISYKTIQSSHEEDTDFITLYGVISVFSEEMRIEGDGNGPLDAMSSAIKEKLNIWFELVSYEEHSLDKGSHSRAIAYIQIHDKYDKNYSGAGIDRNINTASIKALISAINKMNFAQKD